MKLRLWSSLMIFVSSYFPLGFIAIVKDLDPTTFRPQHPVIALVIAATFCFCVVALWLAVTTIPSGLPVTITKVSNRSGDLFAYTIPYMISFYNFNLGDWRTLLCLGIFLLLLFVLAYQTRSVLVNPVLALVGYGLYDAQFKDGVVDRQGMLLSRSEFAVGDVCHVYRLSNFLYLVTAVER